MTKCGVYEIVNTENMHRYVGSSVNIRRRWSEHKRKLRSGKHHSRYLQRAWDLYGASSFKFRVLTKIANPDDRIEVEQQFIDDLQPEYNMTPNASSPGGFEITDSTRELHSKNGKRMMKNPVIKKKCIDALRSDKAKEGLERWHSSEECKRMARKRYERIKHLLHQKKELVCIQCGKKYIGEKGLFCSAACRAKHRRDSGVDDEIRTCIVCGSEFTINKYSNTSTCSRACASSKPVVQINKEGKVINSFNSAKLASVKTGIDWSNIGRACRGDYKTAGGYVWRYAEDGQ